MRDTLTALFMPSPLALRFAVKTLLGALLALWAALRFDLEQPQWAMMTAFIVAQPLAGMVVQKGLARLLGTLCGGIAAVALMGIAAQSPWLFLLGLAAWLALCIAISTQLRSAWAYSFVLAGYTVAIIGLPAISHPLGIFDQAVARCTEISLGIICATLSSALLWPQRVEQQLAGQASGALASALQGAGRALLQAQVSAEGLLAGLGRIVAVDAQREHAWFEGHRGRNRARALQALTLSMLGLSRVSRSIARLYRSLPVEQARHVEPWLRETAELFEQLPSREDLERLRERLAGYRQGLPADEERDCLTRLSVLLLHAQAALRALQGVERGEWSAEGSMVPLAGHRDGSLALLYGIRGAASLLAVALFWLATGWTHAVGAMILAGVICALFASRENAVQIGFSFLRGILGAIPVAFVVSQMLLPQISTFEMLCLALGVPLFLGALCMAKPSTAGTATSFCLHFIVLVAPPNRPSYDAEFFLNEALAMLIGVCCAVLAFRLIHLRSPRWHTRRLLRATLDDLARLTERGLVGAEGWFGGRMSDRLLRLARHRPHLPAPLRDRWGDGLLGLDVGDELLHLRLCLARLGVDGDLQVKAALRRVADALRQGPGPGREAPLERPLAALDSLLETAPSGDERQLAHTAVRQLKQSWRQWCAEPEVAHGPA